MDGDFSGDASPASRGGTAPLRVGIVGVGRVGRRRAECTARHPDLVLTAICDTQPQCQNDYPGVTFYDDWRDLVADPAIDVVFACAYNALAPEVVCAALAAGKHVFCEKPPGRGVDDVRRMIDAERAAGDRRLKFGFNHRYHYSVIEAKALIDSGRYGRVLWARGIYGKCGSLQFETEWRSNHDIAGGGILLDQGIHMLDLCRYFCGDFQHVQSLITTAYWNIPLEDNAFVILSNDAGQVASVHSSATFWKHRFELEICLEDGFINLSGILSSTRSYGEEKMTFARKQFEDTTRALGRPREETVLFDTDDSWQLEVDDFVDAIRQNRPIASGHSHDALRVMELIEEAYSRSPRPVQRDER